MIFASTTPVTAALQRETRTIPIVFVIRLAPASWQALRGQVETSRGSPTVEAALGGKWLQMLKEIAPRVKRVANHVQPRHGARWRSILGPFEAAARSLAEVVVPLAFSLRITSHPAALSAWI